jgi:hypothetical protein
MELFPPKQKIYNTDIKTDLLSCLGKRYDISDVNLSCLKQIENFEIVLICDDSYSMLCPAVSKGSIFCPFLKDSRWQELKNIVSIVIDIATIFDKDGIDIYFLNRPTLFNITDKKQLDTVFDIPPEGYTPLVKTLKRVLADKKLIVEHKNLLIVIATDGIPHERNSSNETVENLKKTLKNRLPIDKIFVSILACTDDKETLKDLNNWDKKIKNLDVLDDYANEKIEVITVQGELFKFSFGDYVVKALLGPIDPYFDSLDEKKI